MAIYHCSISNVSRAKGSSSCATLSYISADKVYEERTAQTYSYGRVERVLEVGTLIPENAPEEYRNPSVLFNSIENYEKAENARTAKKIEVALPREVDLAEQKQIVEDYIRENLKKERYACTDAIHNDKNNNNPHAHILVANRQLNNKGEWSSKRKMEYVLDENGQRVPRLDENGQQKTDKNGRKQWKRVNVEQNPLDKKEFLQKLREGWAVECNKHLDPEQQIDYRSYARQGIEQEPTIHEGYAARKREKQGKAADRCQINREIRSRNALLQQLQAKIKEIAAELAELMRKGEAFYEQRIKRLFIHRTETIGGVYGDAGEGKRKAQKGERRAERRERGSEQGERAAEQRKWDAAERSPEVAGAVEDEPRVSLGSESAKMPLNGDFSDKGVEYVIEQLKEQIEALQKLEEGMQDDLQKARKFLSEQPEVQPKHKTPKRRTGPKI